MNYKRISFFTFHFSLFIIFFSNFAFAGDTASAGNADEGGKLFTKNCAVCHSIGNGKVTGPDLKGVTGRVPAPYQDWMFKWIKNNNAFRKTGDVYANKVYADNQNTAMTVFEGQLTDAQIKDIIAYVANPPLVATNTVNPPPGGPTVPQGADNTLWIVLIILSVLFIIIMVLRTVRKSLQTVTNQNKGLPEPEDLNLNLWQSAIHWIRNHKAGFAVINIVLTSVFCVYGWEYLWGIDVTPGYHPSQPINFRHDVHAGTNSIACVYCHSGAEKGKVAGIPTVNVCMNCHKGIKGSNDEYKKEIAKIYYAAGWDPDKQAYNKPTHPIIWNRVHSLPDFAYFNHSQHVSVGKIACETCHGPCNTYTTNQQFAPLTMGWCIDCHRQTPVHMDGNGYYAKLHQALMKQDTSRQVTEAEMGGTECGKCHY